MAYTVFAEAMDRSGFARGTLAPREGMSGEVPVRRSRPLLTMADMGMAYGDMEGMEGMNMGGADAGMPGMIMGSGLKEPPVRSRQPGTTAPTAMAPGTPRCR